MHKSHITQWASESRSHNRYGTKMKYAILFILFIFASTVKAAGYSNWAVPTMVEQVSNGILVYGSFGDPSSCSKVDHIFVPYMESDDKGYKTASSIIFMAFAAQKELRFYSNSCAQVSAHWTGEIVSRTYTWQSIYIR